MNKRKQLARAFRYLGIALLIILLGGAIAFKIYTSNYYRPNRKVIASIEKSLGDQVHAYKDEQGMVFIPQGQEVKAVIVFYPGGKVDYTSYSGFMYELSAKGYLCLLPRMPENLAFLQINAVDEIKKNYPEETESMEDVDWYLAGHSLGGVAATTYLYDHQGEYAGMILCASYPTKDFTDSNVSFLSIRGSEDDVLNMRSYGQSKRQWPDDATEYVIDGGIHSYFGSYGIQDGDGKPTISNEEQLEIAADVIDGWIQDR